jgi:hypothetical protein
MVTTSPVEQRLDGQLAAPPLPLVSERGLRERHGDAHNRRTMQTSLADLRRRKARRKANAETRRRLRAALATEGR